MLKIILMKNKYTSIEKIIQLTKKGKMFILVDDENKENEGDLVISTSYSNPKNINFMAKIWKRINLYGFGYRSSKKVKFNIMSSVNKSRNQKLLLQFL